MRILVTGGAGYIGSICVRRLLEEDFEVTVVDNLSRGHKEAVPEKAAFVLGDLNDQDFLNKLFNSDQFNGVIHFSGFIAMGESMENPGIYFKNNILGTLNLAETMVKNKNNSLIFSSSAGVYGNPKTLPIPEDDPKEPTNPYGESKLMVENMLDWYSKIYGLKSVSLRYFNACGAAYNATMGENHQPETHLIPLAVRAATTGESLELYGDDYPTPDGTCIRDYIHVVDLVEAHILVLKRLLASQGEALRGCYNVGTGKGYSNREVVEMVRKVTGKEVPIVISSRRPGDAAELVADPSFLKKDLGWEPKNSDLKTIVESAWQWHNKN